ncbi:MAG: flagellar basal body-associated FliL family protein [Burkholderiaceae bacterium]
MATAAGVAAPQGGGKKKLIIILVAVLVLVLGGGAALLMMKKKAHDDEDGDTVEEVAPKKHAATPDHPPTFVPLEPFTVNLADKEVDRFAQVGVTLEISDAKFAEQMKAYMPAIRNNVLMVLSHKNSAELLTREGKEKLAREIMRESVRPLGIELDDDEDAAAADAPPKKKKKKRQVESPVTQVLFSTFIVQ